VCSSRPCERSDRRPATSTDWPRLQGPGERVSCELAFRPLHLIYFNVEVTSSHGRQARVASHLRAIDAAWGALRDHVGGAARARHGPDAEQPGQWPYTRGPYAPMCWSTPDMTEMHRHHSIHPGDTLTGRSTVIKARNSENPRYEGISPWHIRFHNQRDKLVGDYRWTHAVAKQKRSIDG
jgi:hypothetical protein